MMVGTERNEERTGELRKDAAFQADETRRRLAARIRRLTWHYWRLIAPNGSPAVRFRPTGGPKELEKMGRIARRLELEVRELVAADVRARVMERLCKGGSMKEQGGNMPTMIIYQHMHRQLITYLATLRKAQRLYREGNPEGALKVLFDNDPLMKENEDG